MKNQWDYYVYIKRLRKRNSKHYIIYLSPTTAVPFKGEFFEYSFNGKWVIGRNTSTVHPTSLTFINLL